MEIVERKCKSSEDDRSFNFYLMRSRDWCNIIPVIADGKVVMVKQFRIGIDRHTLEVPGGVTDHSDSNCQAAALRELEEETGYAPLPGAKCIHLGWNYPNPAILNNRAHSYIVGPVQKITGQHLDPGEMIETIEVPIDEIPQKIIQGEINHALMLNAFFFLSLQNQKVEESLIQSLNQFTRLESST